MTQKSFCKESKRMTQKSFCKESNPSQNTFWLGLLVLKVGFWVTLLLVLKVGFWVTLFLLFLWVRKVILQ